MIKVFVILLYKTPLDLSFTLVTYWILMKKKGGLTAGRWRDGRQQEG